MIVGCVAFPFGWNSSEVRKICGPDANRFELGLCGIRWAYPLAIIGKELQNYIPENLNFLTSCFFFFSLQYQVVSTHVYWQRWHSFWPRGTYVCSRSLCIKTRCSKVNFDYDFFSSDNLYRVINYYYL